MIEMKIVNSTISPTESVHGTTWSIQQYLLLQNEFDSQRMRPDAYLWSTANGSGG